MARETQGLEDKLNGFRDAAQSLKLYRRAELTNDDDGKPLIEPLYVDPLPREHVFQTLLKPSTTFLIGRKGTGKSTVFQRCQHELRKRSDNISAYVDIKTLYESSLADPAILTQAKQDDGCLSADAIRRLQAHRSFLSALISEIKAEMRKRVESSFISKLKEGFSGSVEELFGELDQIINDANTARFENITGAKSAIKSDSVSRKHDDEASAGATLELSSVPKAGFHIDKVTRDSREAVTNENYSEILIRTFNIREFIERIESLLRNVGVRRLFVFIDDFSELPAETMEIAVDTLLAPLNNWSNEWIKFKVAAYPGRVYYGAIDRGKIDEVFLDPYDLYGGADVSAMEAKAIDFTKRLANARMSHFTSCEPVDFFESNVDAIWRTIFFATMGNPRTLGYMLYYLYESHVIYEKRIGVRAVQDAARRYYVEKIEPFFTMRKFWQASFEERSSMFGLKELLEKVVRRSRELRSYDSGIMSGISGRPPTSHFHIGADFERIFSTLELNFFVTKYYEMKDRDGQKVSIYCLNYGLCQKATISFGRPEWDRKYRLYYVERIFDYTSIIQAYIASNQEISCDACGDVFSFEQLDALKLYGMKCPKCLAGTCQVKNRSEQYKEILEQVEDALLLPETELNIVYALHSEDRPMFAGEIAGELDCSYQLIGRRGKNLDDRGLVERSRGESGRRTFELTDQANQAYFNAEAEEVVSLDEAPENDSD
ncbi:MarR family winged helix-turn-helix transcriptional regulator [Phycisphaeraceae bacterium D3-23]